MLRNVEIALILVRAGFSDEFATDALQYLDTQKSMRQLETEIIEEVIAARSELLDSLDKLPPSLREKTQKTIGNINEAMRDGRSTG